MTMDAMAFLPTLEPGGLTEVLHRWHAGHGRASALALLPESEVDQVGRIQALGRAEGIPIFGAVFPALVAQGDFTKRGAWLLRLDELPYAALHSDLPTAPDRLPGVADALVHELRPHLDGQSNLTLLLLFDALFPTVGTLLDELYLRLANRVHYMGAIAGSETFQPIPCLLDGSRAGGGLLVLLLGSHRGAVLEHGYEVPPRMLIATSTVGNRILQIDWRPAFEVYQALARQEYGVDIDRSNFYQHAVHFPMGIVCANGVIVVRIPVRLEEDGSLFCVGEVPANSMLALLRAPRVDSAETVETLVRGLTALNGPLLGEELLLFACAGRRLHLGGDRAARELAALEVRSGAARVGGALSLGEIGSATEWSYPLFHNGALLASRWGSA